MASRSRRRAEAEEEAPLRVESGKTVVRKVNLTPLYGVHDPGTYHVRANIFFADLNKFFYSPAKGFPGDQCASDLADDSWRSGRNRRARADARTYSLFSNRFADHTSLYVRVENKDTGARLCHLFVRPRHCLRRTAEGNRSRESTSCSALRGAAHLGLFAHRS